MNNIYKVIWSKAKNCYVVASEIARSHTKSATGSGKIGGVTRRSLLASLMALSLLCGGLGVASAEVDVKVDVSSEPGAVDVYTKTGVDTLLDGKADKTALETKANETEVVKNTTNIATNKENITKLENNKADKTYVDTELTKKADVTALGEYAKTADVNAQLANKADKTYVDNAVAGAVATADTNVDAKLAAYATTEDVDTKLAGKANKTDLEDATNRITTNETNITALQKKTTGLSEDGKSLNSMNNVETGALTVKGEISNGTVTTTLTAINDSIKQTGDNKTAIDKLNEKTAEISHEAGGGTNISGVKIKDGNIVGNGNSAITQLANVETDKIKADSINGKSLTGTTVATEKEVKDVADAVKTETDKRKAADTALEGEITKNREDIATLNGKVATAEGNITDLKKKDTELEGRIKTNEGDIETNKNAISDINKRTAGIQRIDATKETTIEGNVTVNSLGNVTAEGDVTAKGKLTGDGVDAGAGAITTKGAVNAGSLNVTDASHLKGDVTMDKKLSVTGDTSLQKTDVDGALTVTGESNLKGNVTLGTPNGTNTVTVNGTANFHEVVNMDKGLTVTGATQLGNTTVDGDLKVTGTITTDKMVFGDKATNNYTEIDKGHITSKNDVLAGDATKKKSSMELDHSKLEVGVTDKDSNGHLTMTADQTSIKNSDLDGKNYSEIVADKDSVTTTVKDEKDNTTSTKSSATEIRNYAKDKDGNKTNNVQTATQNKSWAKDKDGNESSIVQTGKDITNTAQSGTITNDAQNIVNNATGDMTNTVGGELTTTVTGQATENFNGGLDTTVAGTEKHTVNGKQINTVTEGQENIISGGQTNTITGGQTNNITGDQTTTITGNKKETVTENVTEDYQKDLTTTVGGNETHEVKGTKTETVEGKVTENFKNGQETNVTGDQVIKVSGTQTTTATDINRNASSGMIDTIDNDYGTNTETKVAGKTTTDVSIKGTGEKGQYIRGANESRDYLIKDTLKNSETKTAEATSTEITDGINKASTRQDVNNLAGSVTNGTETGVSGIHAKDNSVSIDSIVTDGNKYSVINQKKGSIQSTVVDGTNSTVILQDKDNVTIASSNGTIGIVGKDIVNNAQNTITNTAGTSITNQVKDSKVTTDANGTTFENNTPAVSDGGTTTTKINGNHINTGRVDANELGVSDKDGANTADLSVKAGEGVKASAGNGTTTGSLDVKADEVVSSVKDDASGKGSTFKQRIDAIMGNVKTDAGESEVTQTGDEITSKVGLGEATNSRVTQKKNLLEAAVTDGTNYNISNDTANESAKELRGGTKVNRQYDNLNGSQKTIADGANTNLSIDTASASAKALTDGTKVNKQQDKLDSSEKTITNGTYKTSKVQNALDITNTAEYGTITNDAKNIVNNATGDMTNTVGGKLTTTVTGQATENFKGGLKTDITGEEIHTVTGNQTNKITGKQTNTVEGGQENIISGGQINNITGDQTTTISGTQTTTARDINRNASSGMIDTIDNAYGTNTETKVAGKTTTDVSIKGTGEKGQYIRGANESRDYLIKGTLKNSETKTAEATSTKITDGNGKTSSTIQDVTQISGSVTDGTNTSVSNVKANSIDSAVTDGSSISTINQKKNSITSQVTDGTTITKTEQDTKNITNTAKDGTITNDAKDIVNNASGNMTNTVGGDLTTTVRGNELHEVTGKQTNKIDGDQENTIGGNQTTTVTGDISNKAENITNEANTKLTDKVGENTRVLDSEGITDTVGGSTFKQRIDKIMMESKDVSIKAEETLTNEAKVITNKASEVINNEAVNINNTATGIIKSKASEIQNQADKLISNKVGENTWENMENGKITTSIKDGAKQNLTQSDAAGTTQSTVDGGKSTVTIQNADGLADAVTDGTNTSVQNQTAAAIAAAVKDGAGNENASVANATTSVNTIKSGSKANTVISTADGTSFINSEAAAPVGDGTEVKTTIKGNTITTGKVTMDYAEVMKDLGVRGNANIAGKTTTGSLEVKGESKLTGDVTMESNATVKKDLTVEGNTNLKNTKVDGTLDVTQKANFGDSVSIAKDLSVGGNATITGDVTASSYKVGDKTYISAAGINANDQKITNVADGSISEGSKDAVNGGQLYTVKNDFEGKVNKVGANAAAMANLHPMEFDPDSKWNIAAAIGNYGSETAAALGAFYRPNDDVMVNLSTAFGTGENMVGGGVSVRLGKGGNKLSREESNALKDQVNDLTARMDALLSVLNPNMSKDFPDVPENHWAYEAVSRLAGNDIVQGYPDGEFHGERTMTRYEMAEIIYNALSRGAEAERELVEEFKPELQAMAASEKATAEKAEG